MYLLSNWVTSIFCWSAIIQFKKYCPQDGVESEVYPGLWANVQIAENLINLLFTDVAFRRDSEGDGSGHYESGGGGMSPRPKCHLRACLWWDHVLKCPVSGFQKKTWRFF